MWNRGPRRGPLLTRRTTRLELMRAPLTMTSETDETVPLPVWKWAPVAWVWWGSQMRAATLRQKNYGVEMHAYLLRRTLLMQRAPVLRWSGGGRPLYPPLNRRVLAWRLILCLCRYLIKRPTWRSRHLLKPGSVVVLSVESLTCELSDA